MYTTYIHNVYNCFVIPKVKTNVNEKALFLPLDIPDQVI